VDLQQLVAQSIADTKGSLWPAFGPELILCCTIFLLLIIRMFRIGRFIPSALIAVVGALFALVMAFPASFAGFGVELEQYELFTGMLVYDRFSIFVRALLVLFAALFTIFTWLSGIPDRDDAADFYTLVMGATVGMCLMATANHLLMVFMAIEMASVPSYALAAMLKGRKESSEAALKYSIYGAGAAGVMLYGISLLAGLVGTAHFPSIAMKLSVMLPTMGGAEKMVLALAGLMIFVGLAFKLSAFPFHFWCPDVFEGASAEVNAFLSIASKAGALALLVRMCLGIAVLPHSDAGPPPVPTLGAAVAAAEVAPLEGVGGALFSVEDEAHGVSSESDALAPIRNFLALLIGCLAAVTCTFGNLAAYAQTNIKRLLAYSTIAHAGYMLLTIPVVLILLGVDNAAAGDAISALAIYMAIYMFMNLAAFSIVAFLRNDLFSEEIADYGGLVKHRPIVVVCMGIAMFSLVGIPPLAGFIGKFRIFASIANGYDITGRPLLLALLVIGGVNTVISLFYYLRVMKVMAIDGESDRVATANWQSSWVSGAFIVAVTLPLVVLFFSWNGLNQWAMDATRHLF
jgi:NADH-quinone oxidoreductase subunit N